MTVHFVTKGNHTENVIEVIKKRLNKGDIKTIIVATTKGDTALKMAEEINNCKIVAVTHQAGFVKPGEMEVEKDVLEKLKEKGVIVVTATHALAGIDRAVRKKHGTWELAELMAET